jgi:hypothetical protein
MRMKNITAYLAIIKSLQREAKQMKKSIICMIIICTLFIFSGCGGGGGAGGSGNTPVTISVSFQNNHASSLNPKVLPLTHVRYTVTGPKMKDMQGTVPVIGDAADIDLMVPSGLQRLFKIQILDSSGAVAYFGDTTADLKGDPIKLEIPLHEIPRCNDTVHEGSDNPETFTIELGKKSGTFQFDYETYSIKDRMIITYEGNTLYDSGCIDTNGTKTEYISYSGNSTAITVDVQPNCEGTTTTKWDFVVYCPQDQENKFVGTWAYARLIHETGGVWGASLGKMTFNADGSGLDVFMSNLDGNVVSLSQGFGYTKTKNNNGSYTLSRVYADKTITDSIVFSDNDKMVISDVTAFVPLQFITVGIKMDAAKTYTNADLFGDYYGMAYEHSKDLMVCSTPGLYNAGSSILNFDGIDTFSGLRMINSSGFIYTDSVVSPYNMAADGTFIYGSGSLKGHIGAGASGLFVNSNHTVNNCLRFGASMARGDRVYSTADLAGTWALAGFGDSNEGGSVGSAFGTMTCNINGNCEANLKNRKDGNIIPEQLNLIDITVDPDGSFGYFQNTIAPSYSAVIGNNGNTIMMNMSFGQSDLYEREVLVGVRCSGCSNLAGQAGNVRTKNIYFKKRNNVSIRENQHSPIIKTKGGAR